MSLTNTPATRAAAAVDRQRLLETARALCGIYSPTREAREVLDRLAEILAADGFSVERPDGGFAAAPAVAVRYAGARPGKTLQFDGHVDTVHLPFVPPACDGERLTGSGACDMKGGVATAVEALRALRDADALAGGGVLFTAHDLHEAPWGDGSQLEGMIRGGYVGDAVLIPEYLRDVLAVRGRGQAVLRVAVRRAGPPVHEVYRPRDEVNVIAAGAELVRRLLTLAAELESGPEDAYAGRASLFVGQVHSGEIYNQFPQEFRLEGTRRWLPGTSVEAVEAEYRRVLAEVAAATGATIDGAFQVVRDAFALDPACELVAAFQAARVGLGDSELPLGGKPFVDDGNTFWALARVPAITHGPLGGGAHTLAEWVSVDDLVRVARLYAATAVRFCNG